MLGSIGVKLHNQTSAQRSPPTQSCCCVVHYSVAEGRLVPCIIKQRPGDSATAEITGDLRCTHYFHKKFCWQIIKPYSVTCFQKIHCVYINMPVYWVERSTGFQNRRSFFSVLIFGVLINSQLVLQDVTNSGRKRLSFLWAYRQQILIYFEFWQRKYVQVT